MTFIAVMMRTNYDRLHEIAAVAARFGAPLRINVYQAVRSDAFALTYEEYWDGFAALFARTDAIAHRRAAGAGRWPRPAAAPGRLRRGHRAGDAAGHRAALRLLGGPGEALDALIEAGPAITRTRPSWRPAPCQNRAAAARTRLPATAAAPARRLMQQLDAVDPYCPVVRGDDRRLAVTMAAHTRPAEARERLHYHRPGASLA